MSGNLKTFRIALLCLFAFMATVIQAQTIKGNVKDSGGEPIIGASVREVGTKNVTVTDLDGNFSINMTSGKELQITYIGMKPKTVKTAGKSVVNVVMEDEATALDDVVVIGYGTVKKRDLTGSVASVSAKEIANLPVATASEAIQGKMAGVTVTTTEGAPDADIKIRVRGGGSLSQDNSPLYIVDGFPVSSISDIAPNDIESIDVLKDASSTAIYGARGANGVIIVTTKSGKEGKVQVNFGASLGVRKVAKEVDVLDPYNYSKYQYEARYGKTQEYGDWDDLEIWKSKSGNNWQDQLFGRTGLQQIYNLSVSGGTKETKFNISYSRTDDKGIMENSDFTKDNINAKLNTQLNKWLSLDFNARLSYQVVHGLNSGADTNDSNASNSLINKAVTFRPVEPLTSVSDDDSDESANNDVTPYERITGTYKEQRRFRQDYNAGLNWKPWKNITFRSEFGYTWYYENTDQAWDAKATKNDNIGAGQPKSRFAREDTRSWRNANTLTYDKKNAFFKKDKLNVLVGQEWSSSQEKDYYSSTINFPTNFTLSEVLANQGAGEAQPQANSIGAKDNLVSFFGRLNYTYDDKYLLTATFRADGSSKFASGNRWGYFPAVALGWRISEEEFMKSAASWLSNLKLRLSFGEAGNNRIPSGSIYQPFSFPTDYSKIKAPYFGESVATMMQLGDTKSNKDLKWETTITRNVGIDFGFFNSRINGTLDLYWNTTKDLLMKSKVSSSSGYSYQYKNFGQTSNKGVELALNAAIIEKRNFTLNFSGNISYNRNKIDKLNTGTEWDTNYTLPDVTTGNNFRVVEGGRLGEVWGYKLIGYYTAFDAVNNPNGELVWNGTKWALRDGLVDNSSSLMGTLTPGSPKLKVDENGDPVKERLGNTIAPWSGGFGFNATFHGFDASVFFNYQFGNKIINGTKLGSSFYKDTKQGYNLNGDFYSRYTSIDPATGLQLTNPAAVADTYGGVDNVIARLNEINSGAKIYNPVLVTKMYLTDYAVESASFLRLQNLTIGYTLPKSLLKKIFLNNVRFYFTGYNLFTITGYSGNDPEVDTSSKKSVMSPGVDYASYPKSRLYVFGVNVSF